MNTPNYAEQIVATMQAHNESPTYMLGYFQALLTKIQREAEEGKTTPKRLLEELAHACDVTKDLYNR